LKPKKRITKKLPKAEYEMWNLKKIQWKEAREKTGFHDALEIRVGVLDTGIDGDHPDLEGALKGYVHEHPDFANVSGKQDLVGHGTHVSGTITATINNQIGINGICRCQLNVWKIFTDETTYDGDSLMVYYVDPVMYRRALADAEQEEMDVINLSIGGPEPPDFQERSLIDRLLKRGTSIVAAMGNEREFGSPISYPAAIPGVIAVGATSIDDEVATFSNRGNHIAVSAPGVGIWSTLPTYSGQIGFEAVEGPDGTPVEGKRIERQKNYDSWDGTSMATPHVTAAVALLLANQGKEVDVRSTLLKNSDKVAGMEGDDFSPDYGGGRLNLLKLLR
jgi:subtilisin family serine protease